MTVCTRLFVALGVLTLGCAGPAGENGKPCTVTDNGDLTATILCADGSTVTVRSGANGRDGSNGAPGTNGSNGSNGAPGTNGVNGTSCTVTVDVDAGTKVIRCTDGTQVTLVDGRDGVDANGSIDFAGLNERELAEEDFVVRVASISNAPRPVVRFSVRSRKGAGVRNVPPAHFAGIALLQLVQGPIVDGGSGLDTWVSHISNCATCTSSTETATPARLVDHGDGTYTYTFAKDVVTPTPYDGGLAVAGVAFDASAVHRFGLRLGDPDRANPYRPVDVTFDYVPATGANVDGQNDKVNTSNCLACHNQWRANPKNLAGAAPFHGGQRYDVRYCVVCHNDQRKYSGANVAGNPIIPEPLIDLDAGTVTPPPGRSTVAVLRGEAIINLPVFAHKIHAGEHLALKGTYAGMGTDLNEFRFPQDVRNCTTCHANAAQADNWKLKPSRRACGSCHDRVNFATGQGHGQVNLAQQNDGLCSVCHDAAFIVDKHRPVARPDPSNSLATPGGNANTHAAFIGSAANPPPGARVFQYDIAAVNAVAIGNGFTNAQVRFRFTENDAGVAFNAYDGGAQVGLLDHFVGGPSVYCVFAVPQDGVDPADFNASVSVALRAAWAGTATGASAATMTGPDSSGYYTVTLTGTAIPPSATMLTCGLGYSYNLSSAQPLTQTNVMPYTYSPSTRAGGLSIPMKNAWRVASLGTACSATAPCPSGQICDGATCRYVGRRGASSSRSMAGQVVTSAKCEACHAQVGVSPTYHGGQRNDAATCSFCHTPNRTSSGWSAGAGSFVHAIHAAKVRSEPYNWHAVATTTEEGTSLTGFFGVEYPGRLNACETCHTPGTYDFSSSWESAQGRPTRLAQTVATGTFNANPLPDGGLPALAASVSPYVDRTGATNYGRGFAFVAADAGVTQAEAATLVTTPIANACFGCHDSPLARQHMSSNGALIYAPRSSLGFAVEQCALCHGPGKLANVKDAHSR